MLSELVFKQNNIQNTQEFVAKLVRNVFVFIFHQVAVLLMDTQGVFDNEYTVKDNVSLFALTNLISSVQVC